MANSPYDPMYGPSYYPGRDDPYRMYHQIRSEVLRDVQEMLRGYGCPSVSDPAGWGAYSKPGPDYVNTSHNPPAPKDLKQETIVSDSGLVGWRKWAIGPFETKMKSIRGTVWEPYKRMEAQCKATTCGGATCACGLYAFTTPEQVEKDGFDPMKHVMGEVYLWGAVMECKLGFRAQYSYPKTIKNTGILAEKAAQIYGVKLI